jgi:PAS domain S-box-containing protein
MLIIDPLVDAFVQPDLPFVSLDHFLVGFITGGIGIFFITVTAYLVRRLTAAEFEQEALRKHFDYLSKYANDIVVLIDESRKIIEANDRALSTYGYTREELLTMDPRLLRVPEERDKFDRQLSQIDLESGLIFETLHQRKDGSLFPVEVSARIFTLGGRKYFQSIIRDITERKRAEEAIRLQRDRLRSLAARVESVREEERKLLAREIHDQLGQELTAIKMNIAVLAAREKHDEEISVKMQYIRQLVDASILTVRKIATSLRPGVLDELGLTAAVQWQVAEFEKQFGIRCTHAIDRETILPSDGVSIVLFRILQESLTNVAKHAAATHVRVKMETVNDGLRLTVEDNGRGIDADHPGKKKSLGILGMKERAFALGGTVTIDHLAVGGTRVIAYIPGAVV